LCQRHRRKRTEKPDPIKTPNKRPLIRKHANCRKYCGVLTSAFIHFTNTNSREALGLTFLLTLEDPHRFRKSRDVGCYLGLQPGRRNSGQSEPQMHISKEGDPYLRTLLVQGAQHILGPFGIDCDLRRWGLKLAERGGKSGKKRAIVATARKLAVLLHHLWVSGEVYEPLHNSSRTTVAAAA
jgi:transposase